MTEFINELHKVTQGYTRLHKVTQGYTTMRYKIIDEENRFYLETQIKTLLKTGWELIGGVSISHSRDGIVRYAQAMILKEKGVKK